MRKHELIHVFYKRQPFYESTGEKLEKPYIHVLPITKSYSDNLSSTNLNEEGERIYKTYTHSTKHSIIKVARKTKGGLHPTQKPVELLEYLIKTYTVEGETVLDNCMGSGSTGIACINTRRKFIGIEQLPTEKDNTDYFGIAKKRIQEHEDKDIFKDC